MMLSNSKKSKLSKSVISKSLSVLERVKHMYKDIRDDTSRTIKRDVRLTDLLVPTPSQSSKIKFMNIGIRYYNDNIGIEGLDDDDFG
jgi:hypothetical protein